MDSLKSKLEGLQSESQKYQSEIQNLTKEIADASTAIQNILQSQDAEQGNQGLNNLIEQLKKHIDDIQASLNSLPPSDIRVNQVATRQLKDAMNMRGGYIYGKQDSQEKKMRKLKMPNSSNSSSKTSASKSSNGSKSKTRSSRKNKLGGKRTKIGKNSKTKKK
jgi:prefoldin subunit 5